MISTWIIERLTPVGRWKLPLLVRSGIFCFFVSGLGWRGLCFRHPNPREGILDVFVQGLIIWVLGVGGFIVCLSHGLAMSKGIQSWSTENFVENSKVERCISVSAIGLIKLDWQNNCEQNYLKALMVESSVDSKLSKRDATMSSYSLIRPIWCNPNHTQSKSHTKPIALRAHDVNTTEEYWWLELRRDCKNCFMARRAKQLATNPEGVRREEKFMVEVNCRPDSYPNRITSDLQIWQPQASTSRYGTVSK